MSRVLAGVLTVVGTITIPAAAALADPALELGGTAGVHVFSDDSKLGMVTGTNATGLQNSSLFGIRIGVYFKDTFGIEVEGGVIPTEPSMVALFDVYTMSLRGQLVYQFATENIFVPFVDVGFGVLDNVYSKNTDIVRDNTVIAPGAGVGAKYHASGGWGVRFDLRVSVPPKVGGSVTTEFEGLASLYHEFGVHRKAKVEPAPVATKTPTGDQDGDGIPDAKDKCPKEAEDKDGFQDEDGCPDPDNDNDGIPDTKDKCPNEAEDKDGFQDEDGCPDPDNDNDGIPDAADKCPDKPETRNGFQDDDGCPDELPDALKAVVAPMAGVTFKPSSADFAPGATAALDKLAAVLATPELKSVKYEIAGHTDDRPQPKGAKQADVMALSQARADAVKAYLVKKGVDEGHLTAKGYGDTEPLVDPKPLKGAAQAAARTKNARVELKVVTPEPPAAPAAPAAPAPATPAAPAPPAPAAPAAAPASP